jgi:hypothetical protein
MLKKRDAVFALLRQFNRFGLPSRVYCFDDLLDEFHEPRGVLLSSSLFTKLAQTLVFHAVFLFDLLLQSIGNAP